MTIYDLKERIRAADEASPQIRVMPGDLAKATRASLGVLANSRHDPLQAVYVRGKLLMRPVRLRDRLNAEGIRRPMNALALHAVDADWLSLRLMELAEFVVTKGHGKETPHFVPVDIPKRVSASVLASAPWDGLPTLAGIIEAPTILLNGTIIQKPGYDPESGLLFDPGHTAFPEVPAAPSREQAEAALEPLITLFKDFPFVDEAARSVALAAVFTALVRRGLRAAPMFAFDAPKMAIGKTLLATVASYIASGRTPYLISQLKDQAEEQKRLLSALMENPAVVILDNVEYPLRSAALNTVLTEPTYTDRLLGVNKTVTVASNCTFMVTGNNLVIAGDLSSRALLCRLDPEVERPEEREFPVDLHEWVPAHRGELAVAALTVIAAYLAAGAPKPQPAVPNFARFEQWQRLCRFPLIWLGRADPCATRAGIEAGDPVREHLCALLAAWHAAFGSTPTTVARAIATASDPAPGDAALTSVMKEIALDQGGISSRKLGAFLKKHDRRIEGGLRFEKAGKAHGTLTCWRVTPA